MSYCRANLNISFSCISCRFLPGLFLPAASSVLVSVSVLVAAAADSAAVVAVSVVGFGHFCKSEDLALLTRKVASLLSGIDDFDFESFGWHAWLMAFFEFWVCSL